MIKTFSIFVLVSVLFVGCKHSEKTEYTSRSAASEYQLQDEGHRISFDEVMSEKTDEQLVERVANYLKKQKAIFDIAQNLLVEFDKELESLYQKSKRRPLKKNDNLPFAKIKFKNYIAWEFSDRNLHEISDVYYLALKYANNPNSEYHQKSKLIISKVEEWIGANWKTGNKRATLYLASELIFVHGVLKSEIKDAVTPNLDHYAYPSKELLAEAYSQKYRSNKNMKKSHIKIFMEKQWKSYLAERSEEIELDFLNTDNASRSPQSGELIKPSAVGSEGNLFGTSFPKGKWALTFDDGPHVKHTKSIIDVLAKHQVHATFFWLAKNITAYPSMAQVSNPHYSRALHSYSHANLPKLTQVQLEKEITTASSVFSKVIGGKPTLFRCPYGACGKPGSAIRQLIANNGMVHVAWNVDSMDWQDKNADSVFLRTKKQVDVLGRGIILFHDIHPQSVLASDKLISYMKTKYKIEPLNKIIEQINGQSYYTP